MSRIGAIRRVGALLSLLLLFASPARAQSADADAARVELIERVSRSVVHVIAEPPAAEPAPVPTRKRDPTLDELMRTFAGPRQPPKQQGSGFVVDQVRGMVVTAAHIAAGAKSLSVASADGSQRPAELVGVDEEGGVALLRVAGLNLPSLALSKRAVRAGETALVVGWMIPLKTIMPIEGMVMGPAPGVDGMATAPPFADYVALNAVLPNGGFGGGPVVDRDGAVIGLVSAILGVRYGADALTMMIPASGVAAIVKQLAARGRVERSEIGVALDCTPDQCKIGAVDEDSPAEAAGLRADDAILAVDGVPTRTESGLRRAIGAKPIGSVVALTIWRDGRLNVIQTKTIARVTPPR